MSDSTLKKWDLVSPINWQGTLASGCGRWTEAVVLQPEPLILICEDGDMVWFSQNPDNFIVIGKAGEAAKRNARNRIRRDDHLRKTLSAKPSGADAEAKV